VYKGGAGGFFKSKILQRVGGLVGAREWGSSSFKALLTSKGKYTSKGQNVVNFCIHQPCANRSHFGDGLFLLASFCWRAATGDRGIYWCVSLYNKVCIPITKKRILFFSAADVLRNIQGVFEYDLQLTILLTGSRYQNLLWI
jgi:hypothetical protein